LGDKKLLLKNRRKKKKLGGYSHPILRKGRKFPREEGNVKHDSLNEHPGNPSGKQKRSPNPLRNLRKGNTSSRKATYLLGPIRGKSTRKWELE